MRKSNKVTTCEALRLGLHVGNAIFLVAGVTELICKGCTLKCPYTLKDYSKQNYKQAIRDT